VAVWGRVGCVEYLVIGSPWFWWGWWGLHSVCRDDDLLADLDLAVGTALELEGVWYVIRGEHVADVVVVDLQHSDLDLVLEERWW
jgi:hypothetical protein